MGRRISNVAARFAARFAAGRLRSVVVNQQLGNVVVHVYVLSTRRYTVYLVHVYVIIIIILTTTATRLSITIAIQQFLLILSMRINHY